MQRIDYDSLDFGMRILFAPSVACLFTIVVNESRPEFTRCLPKIATNLGMVVPSGGMAAMISASVTGVTVAGDAVSLVGALPLARGQGGDGG